MAFHPPGMVSRALDGCTVAQGQLPQLLHTVAAIGQNPALAVSSANVAAHRNVYDAHPFDHGVGREAPVTTRTEALNVFRTMRTEQLGFGPVGPTCDDAAWPVQRLDAWIMRSQTTWPFDTACDGVAKCRRHDTDPMAPGNVGQTGWAVDMVVHILRAVRRLATASTSEQHPQIPVHGRGYRKVIQCVERTTLGRDELSCVVERCEQILIHCGGHGLAVYSTRPSHLPRLGHRGREGLGLLRATSATQ